MSKDTPVLSRPVIAVTNLRAAIEADLAAHWSRPEVIRLSPDAPPWTIPEETNALVTNRRGWADAPAKKPPRWPEGLRWIQTEQVGIDAFPKWMFDGAVVSSAKGVNAPAVAEYAMTAMLIHERDFGRLAVHQESDWKRHSIGSLEGKVLGLAGYGHIGRAIAQRALAFDMKVCAFRRSGWPGAPDPIELVSSINDLLARADHVVLAMPATPLTRGLINRNTLASLKPGLHLINIARGSLIDHAALLEALDDGRLSAATLDVTDPEPLPEGHRLYNHPRVRLTPHIAGQGAGNSARFRELVLRNLDAFVSGRPLENVIDAASGY